MTNPQRKPSIVITVGSTDYTLVLESFPDGSHVIQTAQRSFPSGVPTSNAVDAANYQGHRVVGQEAPLGMGLRNRFDPRRVADMNADARFPRLITLPRLQTTTTFPAGVTAVSFRGFTAAIGELFMWGIQTTGEHILVWDGNNWADATFDADTAGNKTTIGGMCEHKGRVVVISHSGGDTTISDSATGFAWADLATPAGGTGSTGLVSDGANLYKVLNSTTVVLILQQSTDNGATWVPTNTTVGTFLGTARGLVVFGDGLDNQAKDVWFTAREGLYHLDVNADYATSVYTKLVNFQYVWSPYSGQLIATPHGLVFTDGPEVFLGAFGENNQFFYKALGINGDDGLPLIKQGDVTWLAYDGILDELAVGKGGDGGSRNQSIFFYSFKTNLITACMGQNATANRVSWAGIYSSEAIGINSLHYSRDGGVANDSEALYLQYVSENPDVQTACTFDTTGYVTRSRFDGGLLLFRKAFFQGQYAANDLTNTETLSVKYATDGGALGSAQVTTTTNFIQALWTDGSATALGSSAYDIYDEITLARAA